MTASPACLSRQVGDFLPPAGGVPGWLPAAPAISFAFCPLSPRPLPRRGRGRPWFFHARGSAPCIPGAEPKRRWEQGRTTRPAGGVPGWSAADLAAAVPGGGRACFVACYLPPLACFPAPYPPSPRSQSDLPRRHLLSLPRGRGPSQTPKFLSPGPPSPWLPSLLKGKRFLPFLRRTIGSAPGMQGAEPLA